MKCKRHNWFIRQNPIIRMQYDAWCCVCGLKSEPDILLNEDDWEPLRRRLIRNAKTKGE